eukprot:1459015-Rhodomonas_salina.4
MVEEGSGREVLTSAKLRAEAAEWRERSEDLEAQLEVGRCAVLLRSLRSESGVRSCTLSKMMSVGFDSGEWFEAGALLKVGCGLPSPSQCGSVES